MSAEPAIVASDLVRVYPGGVRALDGLSFEVAAGEIFGLLGPNGAGKSTTVRILATLGSADGGSAAVAGHDVSTDPIAVRRAIGYVSQRSGVDGEATARENLALQGRMHGMRGADLAGRVDELLDALGLAEAADRVVRGYSGGMKRRLDIGLGLIHRPRVLFLDEPTTGLDPEARALMWRELRALAARETLTVLLTTHYLEEADELSDRLAIVDRGKVVAEGTADDLKRGLQGDAVTVDVGDRASAAVAALSPLESVLSCTADGRLVRARVDDGGRATAGVVAALDAAGIPIVSVTIARPSLDDVYLHHTGRDFHRVDTATSPPAA